MLKKFSKNLDLQSDPNDLAQLELLPEPRPLTEEVPRSIVLKQRDMEAAIRLTVQASGLADKQIYGPLGIDASTFTKFKSRQAYFPAFKLDPLLDVAGNEIALQWWANHRGYDLVPQRTAIERERDELRAEVEELRRDRAKMIELFKAVRT